VLDAADVVDDSALAALDLRRRATHTTCQQQVLTHARRGPCDTHQAAQANAAHAHASGGSSAVANL